MDRGVRNLPFPTEADVDRIAALSDPVLRNLHITQCYYELSQAVRARTGANANWCTFATWASKQAGQTIRKEDLARTLESILRSSPEPALAASDVAGLAGSLGGDSRPEQARRSTWDALDLFKAVEQSSAAVARGNQKVFDEIGREFARFCAACLDDPAPDPDKLALFCDGLRPGDPPDGQGLLRQAFTHLYAALFESDPKQQAERMLCANLLIGYHEQTRLQPEIQAALDAPFLSETQFIQRFLQSIFSRTTALMLFARMVMMRLLGRPPLLELALRALYGSAQRSARQALTELVMALRLPGDLRLRLWSDLAGRYPAALEQLSFPDLRQFLEGIDPTPDSLRRSGAVDWANLPERLHFIADLFRLYQQNSLLFDPPFTPDQVLALKAGRLPDGRL